MTTFALYGGSFDPPHMGHILVATYVAERREIERILVVPTYQHALGKTADASYQDRLAMCSLAFASNHRAIVSNIEAELGGVSRTFDTLSALCTRYPSIRWRLVVGADLVSEISRWHRSEELLVKAPLLVVGRSGYSREATHTVQLPRISSSEARAALQQGSKISRI
ncbi:MAG: nicotinate (nicotinamide) nucleotide adenylyltransferase, partial [Myxococcota bacterium]